VVLQSVFTPAQGWSRAPRASTLTPPSMARSPGDRSQQWSEAGYRCPQVHLYPWLDRSGTV